MNPALALREVPLLAVWVGVAVVSVAAVMVAPLAAFVLMISAFGLPHVLYELRYVDERFSARLKRRRLALLGGLVGTIALGRIANGAHLVPPEVLVPVELFLGAALALVASGMMRRHRWVGLAAGLMFAAGAVFAPIATFLVWAWVHNLTPLGFVAEITQGEERRRWLVALIVPFFVLPAMIASGVLQEFVAAVAAVQEWQTFSVFGAGGMPLLSFLPPGSSDLNLFSAAVVAQAMHYVAVIVLLPRLLREKQGAGARPTVVPWPSWPVFAGLVAAVAAVAFGIYAVSYTDARASYAVAAAIHAWIELPVLLLAMGEGFTARR